MGNASSCRGTISRTGTSSSAASVPAVASDCEITAKKMRPVSWPTGPGQTVDNRMSYIGDAAEEKRNAGRAGETGLWPQYLNRTALTDGIVDYPASRPYADFMRIRSFQKLIATGEAGVPPTHISSRNPGADASRQEADSSPRSLSGLVFGSLLGAILWLGLILTGAILIK